MTTRTYFDYVGKIHRWIDGDTVDVCLDLGFSIYSIQRFRLARINTPEKGQDGAQAAIDFVNKIAPKDCTVYIESCGRDKYGRWIAEIISPIASDHIEISDMLVEQNLAKYYK